MYIMTRNNKKEDMNLKEIKERYMGEGGKERETCNHILKKNNKKVKHGIISQTQPCLR